MRPAGYGGRARYGGLSLWWDGIAREEAERPERMALHEDQDVDVAVVGAGFTGLWTALYLARADPSLRVALVEAEVAGFGASGRNGGWCSALFSASDSRIAKEHGHDAARSMRRAMKDSVDEVMLSAALEGIDCRAAKGGTVVAARNRAQVLRARAEVEEARAFGLGEEDLRWMQPAEAQELIRVEGLLGATFTPHCAALDPVRLARGLARAVEARGVSLYERTRALAIEPGAGEIRPRVRTSRASIRADVVVRAVEGWTSSLRGETRRLMPIYSLMIATEPLPESFWKQAGLARRETFSDHRHLVIYGQRTADGRLAFGGRGAPYHFASAVRSSYERHSRIHDALRDTLVELFPELRDASVTHRWGGPLGVPRDWFSSVGLDRPTGLAWAGGYVGDGVSTANLAGRTLADLILGNKSELVELPWVGHRSPAWEPEPLRWLGVNAALWAMKAADRGEAKKGAPSPLANRLRGLIGD